MQDTFDRQIDSRSDLPDAEVAQTPQALCATGDHSDTVDHESAPHSNPAASGPTGPQSVGDSAQAPAGRDARLTGAAGHAGSAGDAPGELSASVTDAIGGPAYSHGGQGGPPFMVGVGAPFAGPAPKPIPPKFYRIGEVVDFSGLSRQTIHNYTTMGLLPESRWTAGGHRLYDESTFERLNKIAELKAQRKSLACIREYFAGLDSEADRRCEPAM